jgi:hypothetical protein
MARHGHVDLDDKSVHGGVTGNTRTWLSPIQWLC